MILGARVAVWLMLAWSAAVLTVYSVRYAAPVALLAVRLIAPRLLRRSA